MSRSCIWLAPLAILLSLAGDVEALDREAEDLAAASIEHGFPLCRAQGMIFRGWAKAKLGNVVDGISLLRRGSSAYRATGSEVWTNTTGMLRVACNKAGKAAPEPARITSGVSATNSMA